MVHNARYAMYDERCVVHYVRCMIRGLMSNVWCMVYDVRCMLCDGRQRVRNVRSQMVAVVVVTVVPY